MFDPRDQHFAGLRPAASVGASPLPPQSTVGPAQVTFIVHNHKTKVFFAPPQLAHAIYESCAYPTQTAQALRTGWRPPEADFGEAYWDGWVRLSQWNRGQPGSGIVPTGLLQHCVALSRSFGFEPLVVDERQKPDPGVPDVPAIPLYDYQILAVEKAIAAGRGVIDAPPRAGKTRIGVEVVRRLWLPAVWVAPTSNIVTQTVRVFDELLGKNFAVQLMGTRTWQQETHRPVIVCTASTAASLPAEFYRTREVLLIDEIHHGASPQYHEIGAKADGIYYRYGMSGTFTRSGNDEIALHALLSNVVYKITTTELVARQRLTPLKVAFMPVDGPAVSGTTTSSWLDKRGVGRLGIVAHDHRNALATWAAACLVQRGKKVLVLVATKDQGATIEKALREHVPSVGGTEFKSVEFVSTNRPAPVCRRIIDSFVTSNEVQVLIGTSMVGEGTDLPSADALVYAVGGKAEVSHRQAMFRVATAYAKKRFSLIVDFSDRHHKTLMQHALERASTYLSEPIADVVSFQKPDELPAWLSWIESVAR